MITGKEHSVSDMMEECQGMQYWEGGNGIQVRRVKRREERGTPSTAHFFFS